MKVDFNSRGDLVIKPESTTERFALQAWANTKSTGDNAGGFIIDLTPPPMPPSMPTDPKYIREF